MKIIKHFAIILPILTTPIFQIAAYAGQSITPVVSNYNKRDYGQQAQNWCAGHTGEGMMHFANNSGLLSFDGIRWTTTPMPQGKGLRALLCSEFGGEYRVYAGSFEEFGYYESRQDGSVVYVSLSDRLGNRMSPNDEIWTILDLGGKIFFHAFTNGYLYSPEDDSISSCRFDSFVEAVGVGNGGQLLCSAHGLSELDPVSGTITPIEGSPVKGRMVAVLPRKDDNLIITRDEGIFSLRNGVFKHFKTEIDSELGECAVNRAMMLGEDIIIGSTMKGCYRISPEGKEVWHVDSGNTLQSNTVLGIGCDIDGNIWLGLDSGISCINGNRHLRCLSTGKASIGEVYCTCYDEPYLYIGTNQGLYVSGPGVDENSDINIRQIPEVKGNVWFLDNFSDQVICGANDATYELKNGGVTSKMVDVAGGGCMASGIIHSKEVLVMGSYTQLCVFLKKDGRWTFSHFLEGFIEPVSHIGIDFMGNIWAGHMYKGLFRISLSKDLGSIESIEKFDNLSGDGKELITVNNIKGRVVFSNGHKTFTYDDMSRKIIPYDAINGRLGRFAGAWKIRRHDGDMAWMIKNREAALVDFSVADSISIVKVVPYESFGSTDIDFRQDIKLTSKGVAIFTMDDGLGLLDDFRAETHEQENRLRIMNIRLSDRRKEDTHFANVENTRPIRFKDRLITVNFSCPRFSPAGETLYSYFLEGRDKVWNELGHSEELELNYLKPGKYTLHLKAYDVSMSEVGSTALDFRIRQPFYLTWVAYLIYASLLAGIVIGIILSIQRRARSKEQELVNKNLQDELNAKSKLIASNTMSLIRKNEILSQIKEELISQKKELGDAYPDRYYRKMMGTIDSQISSEEDWEIFQHNFDRIHSGFFTTLKNRYPNLTSTDLRFCAYLCLNLTSKEIASMMNVSLKGVEAARYRIRKKIGLASDLRLTEFMMNLK